MSGELPRRLKSVWEVAAQRSQENGLKVTTYERKGRRYDVVSSANRFVDIAFDGFDLKQVCAIIMSENPSFPGHKDALAAALCGWMLGHGEGAVFRRRSVALSVATTLAKAERSYAGEPLDEQLASLRHPPVSSLPPAFFAELYYPIGSLGYIVQTPARYGLRSELTELRNRLFFINMIAAIDHIHQILSIDDTVLTDLSLPKTFELARLIEKIEYGARVPNNNNLRYEYVKKFERSIPLLYAASTMPHSKTVSLLGAIANANWSSILRPGVLRELLGRAVYYAETIYGRNVNIPDRASSIDYIMQTLDGVERRPFEPPEHVLKHRALIGYFYSASGQEAYENPSKAHFWSALGLPVPKLRKGAKGGRLKLAESRRADRVGGLVRSDSKSK
ncbi:hypothetical protein [Methylobacterium aquaticum]|uniref:Uncharacterized protein n=1 Tax=Methylobacterium aquaticum TaxID=270351 RepID=A0A0C6FN85_9HYPH|nr:hypothetical protein [Methylobacterium aquaticum]BAQ46714.1 hypothetical protein Maq22A_c18075 [Methylobacterium aquaticum]